MRRISVWG